MYRYSRADLLRILRLTARQFAAWEKAGLVPASESYSFFDLLQIKKIRDLCARKVRPAVIRQSLDLMIRIGQQEGSTHLSELRQVLEPEIAALAASRIEDQLLATMREAVLVMDRSLHDPDAYIEADLDFHLAMAEAVGNPLILSLLDSIVGLLREQRSRIFNVDGGPERGQLHHKRVLEAIEQRDPEKTRATMRDHLQQVREDSQASLTNKKPVASQPRS